MLCETCEKFRETLNLCLAQEILLHDRFDSLVAGSKAGCHLCRMIESDLHRQRTLVKIESDYQVFANILENKGLVLSFRMPVQESGKSKSMDDDVKVIAEQLTIPDGIEKVFQAIDHTEDTHTGSSSALSLANAWLIECSKHHPHCNTSEALQAQLPTRVIDVGSADSRDDVRLFETKRQMKGSYIALSHCWGGNSHVQTTTESLSELVSKIDMAILPKTFAHAIDTTRRLGIRYLWIDSLCIVQNSSSDWEYEASQMGTYYKNALVTISAAHGSNSAAGLFVERDSLSSQPCALSIKYGNSWKQTYMYARDTSFQLSKSSLGELKAPLPLYSRSWVLQEQLLAPRTLTYGRFGSSWRCQTMRFDERVPLGVTIDDLIKDKPGNLATFRGDPREVESTIAELQRNWIFPRRYVGVSAEGVGAFQVFHIDEHCSPTSDHFVQDWGRLVQDYTSRGMTRQTDKLIALSGIASIISLSRSLEYIAGIWNGSHDMLVQGLLWSASKRGPRLLDIAPSWSWASIQCEVLWSGHLSVGFHRTTQVISFKYSGTATQGQGAITLRSRFRYGIVSNDGSARLTVHSMEGNIDESSLTTISPHWSQGVISLDEVFPENTQLFFVEVAAGKVNYTRKDNLLYVLVLKKDNHHHERYQRVGFSTWNENFYKGPTEVATKPKEAQFIIY